MKDEASLSIVDTEKSSTTVNTPSMLQLEIEKANRNDVLSRSPMRAPTTKANSKKT